jgi:hypothetical protein
MTEPFDLQAMLVQAQQMQQQLLDAQQAAAEETVEGTSGGGMVRVSATGAGEFTAVRIDPTVIDPAEADMLEDLILAALHDVATQVAELNQQRLGDLGLGLGGMLGGASDE